jgi:hypothetical protein
MKFTQNAEQSVDPITRETRSGLTAPEALRALFELEKQMPDRDIVLVRADTSDEVRPAFKNTSPMPEISSSK